VRSDALCVSIAMMTLDPHAIAISIFFGFVGYAAWRYGRKTDSIRHMLLAGALMAFPYFISGFWPTALIGVVLISFLFWP
jgi:hypothetical protein